MSHEIEHLPKAEALRLQLGDHLNETESTELIMRRFGGRERSTLAGILLALSIIAGLIFGWSYLLGALPIIVGSMFISPNKVTMGQKQALTERLASEKFAEVKREYGHYQILYPTMREKVMAREMKKIEFPKRWSKGSILVKDQRNYRQGGRIIDTIEVKGKQVFHTVYKTDKEEDVWLNNFNQALDL